MPEFTDTTTGAQHAIRALLEWKFSTAKAYIDTRKVGMDLDPRTCLDALAATFGNTGRINGSMEPIICAAINYLCDYLKTIEE